LNIISLPDFSTIKGYEIGADGDIYFIEVATTKYYRFYSYWEPQTFKNKFEQAKSMVEILDLIKQQFSIGK